MSWLEKKSKAIIIVSLFMTINMLLFQNCTQNVPQSSTNPQTLYPLTVTAIEEIQEKISCVPGTTTRCSSTGKVGTKICNARGSGYGSCEYTDCAEGYEEVGNECVTSCITGTRVSCDDSTGIGTKACDAKGISFGHCQFTNCFPPYTLHRASKTCYLNAACGSAASESLEGEPQPDQLCKRGTAGDITRYGSFQWEWTCSSGPSKMNCRAWSSLTVKCSHFVGFNNDDSLNFLDTIEFIKEEVTTPLKCFIAFKQNQPTIYQAQALQRCSKLPFYRAKKTNINYFYRLNDEDQTQSLYSAFCE